MKKLTLPGRYGDGNGLWLQVRDAHHRSWLLRYKFEGRARQMGLGPVELVTLAEAREAGLEARKLVFKGIDPIDHRKAAKVAKLEVQAVFTFQQVAERYIAAHEAGWRNEKHRYQWGATLKNLCYPVLGDKPVDQIDTGLVMRILDGLWQEKPETATRVRGRIESILDYAKARGWRAGENPARWKGHLENLLPKRSKVAKVKHHAALPWLEMGSFMEKVRSAEAVSAWALEFTILTAARTGETIGARWSEIDVNAGSWTIPAERMKAGQEHRVPLSGRAIELLEQVTPFRTSDASFVFPGARVATGLSQMALIMTLRRLGHGHITVHGFRSTFRDWAAESTNYPREVAEAALAHTLRDRVEAAYRRSDLFDKRRQLLSEWEAFCARPARMTGDVVPMRAAS
ncbi:integrase arm-type DNA-binding domain-containing protein [Lichenicola cladoniae]|uniref:Integrase arm-type DNA-binding domain-containing protein n=1 Tax=Lichenicola cladoniae TaxID=1484109 RepID=A0A6M8HLA1_9PROT|nr:site-specific integrase [Lichenicola cladoniae]NPD68932.1 integrase arm-type DNA-binding domain-containing protein [Acetobacteraceae bacterium]QKE89122.1 integrase arm-type DNA-binding domain-containing protein [Lichenicola cladoniae]